MALVTLMLVGLLGCAQGLDNIERNCTITDEDKGTLEGHWSGVPVSVNISTSNINVEDQLAVTQSVDSWNRFMSASRGYPIFNYGSASNPNLMTGSPPANFCPSGGSTSTANLNIKVFGVTAWTADPQVIAQTIRCIMGTGSDGLPIFGAGGGAMILVNYQNFFTTSQKPDLRSVLTHEFGHALGLGHSCTFGNEPFRPNCEASSQNSLIVDASMFPTFSFTASGVGEIRRNLNRNDMGRGNCLYPRIK